jgi:hypothetical protein
VTFVHPARNAVKIGAQRPNAGMSPQLQNWQLEDEVPKEMLFILIPIAWLGVLTLIVTLCHTAAHGDAQLSGAVPPASGPIGVRLTLDAAPPSPSRELRRPHRRPAPRHVPAAAARRRRLAAHSGR